MKRMSTRLVLAVIVLVIGAVWFLAKNPNMRHAAAAAAGVTVTLKDEVENLPASSMKAIPFTIPNDSQVEIGLEVVRGNPVNVFLADINQRDAIEKQDWKNVQAFRDFEALKTKTYKRTSMLPGGTYYLVLRDPTLGILSATASDIAIKIRINP
jgi:hypothetical protein